MLGYRPNVHLFASVDEVICRFQIPLCLESINLNIDGHVYRKLIMLLIGFFLSYAWSHHCTNNKILYNVTSLSYSDIFLLPSLSTLFLPLPSSLLFLPRSLVPHADQGLASRATLFLWFQCQNFERGRIWKLQTSLALPLVFFSSVFGLLPFLFSLLITKLFKDLKLVWQTKVFKDL